jgi:hypothetical protein
MSWRKGPPRQARIQKQADADRVKRKSERDKAVLAAMNAISNQLEANQQEQNAADSKKKTREWWTIFGLFLTAAIALCGVAVSIYQATQTQASLRLTEISARAAQESVSSYIKSERGELFIGTMKLIKKYENDPDPTIEYSFINTGRGAVVIVELSVECSLTDPILPEIPTYDAAKKLLASSVVSAGSTIGFGTPTPTLPPCIIDTPLKISDYADISSHKKYILINGYIRYRDNFGGVYRRQFSSIYGKIPEAFVDVMNPGYNQEIREDQNP